MLDQLLKTVYCSFLICTYEHPSDPLASTRISSRSSRFGPGSDFLNDIEHDFPRSDLSPVVSTGSGQLEGYVMKTIKGRSIYAFEGIPFAESTEGSNRFKPAIPKRPWTGVKFAKKPGDFCLQLHLMHVMQAMGSEDCLFLNIYTPTFPISKKKKNLPVIVWIHGGSWFFGSGAEYGPSYLLEHDVILVTVNYRLGIFGFLSTGDSVLPGNLGLKDQALALKWVHENIVNFGGDPALVTLAGQSSGAASVHFHMMSKASREYFSGAFSMSGTVYSSWAIMTRKVLDIRNRKLASVTNCPHTSSQDYVDCLRRMNGHDLVLKFWRLYDFSLLPTVPLGAVIEGEHPGAFLTEHPDETYARNEVAKVPWICTRTANEVQVLYTAIGMMRILPSLGNRRNLRRIYERMAPLLLDYKYVADDPASITRKVIEFYLGDTDRSNLRGQANMTAMAEIATDRIFGYGMHKSLQLHSRVAPTYSYIYAYQAQNSLGHMVGLNPKELGVSHIDDLSAYFNISTFFPGYKTADPDYAIVKLLTSTMYNFALKREPLFTDEEGNTHKIWLPIKDPRNMRVLQIDNDVRMISEPSTERLKFWENVGLPDIKPFIPFQ